MANAASGSEPRIIDWRAVLSGGFFTIVFMLSADLVTRGLGAVSIAPALSGIAFFLAGMVALRLVPDARPLEPALGAAAAIVLFALADVAFLSQADPAVSAGQIAVFIVTLALMAFLLTLLGARLSKILRARRTSART